MSERPNDAPDGPIDEAAPEPVDEPAIPEQTLDDTVVTPDGEVTEPVEATPADIADLAPEPVVPIEDVAAADAVDEASAEEVVADALEEGDFDLEVGDAEEELVDDEIAEAEADAADPDAAISASAAAAAAGAAAGGVADRHMSPAERRAARAAARTEIPVDPSLRIKDRASSIFVLVTALVFALILLNGMVLGRGGFLTPIPTPSPTPTLGPSPSPTAAPSGSPGASPSGSPAASPSAAPSPTAPAAPTATPVSS